MREILFRGKRVDNKQWTYGTYVKATHHWHKNGVHKDWIVETAFANGGWFNVSGRHAVDPETIGQYTGLTDKNGKNIFEGDICLIEIPRIDGGISSHICRCKFEDGCFWFCSEDDYWFLGNEYGYYGTAQQNIEVIGNIYDEEKK